jgi:mannose-6-phosphate isomerase-like protein (cupin superfamily)
MLIRKLKGSPEIVAGDETRLRELLHPDREYDFDGRFSLAHAVLEAGQASTPHRLISTEVYFILSGTGLMHIDSESASIEPGDAVVIPPETEQWLDNTGQLPLEFLCIVDPAWRAEDEEILD